jgi:hypothetical protein
MDIISPIEVPERDPSAVGLWQIGVAADAYLARRAAGTVKAPAGESTLLFIPHTPASRAQREARLAARRPDGTTPRVYRFRRNPVIP